MGVLVAPQWLPRAVERHRCVAATCTGDYTVLIVHRDLNRQPVRLRRTRRAPLRDLRDRTRNGLWRPAAIVVQEDDGFRTLFWSQLQHALFEL